MLALAAQCSNAIAKRRERTVDFLGFFKSLASGSRFFDALRTGQIDQIEAGLDFHSVASVFTGNVENED